MKVVGEGGFWRIYRWERLFGGAPMEVSFDLVGGVVVQAKGETRRAIASSWRGLGIPHRDRAGSMITLLYMQ